MKIIYELQPHCNREAENKKKLFPEIKKKNKNYDGYLWMLYRFKKKIEGNFFIKVFQICPHMKKKELKFTVFEIKAAKVK